MSRLLNLNLDVPLRRGALDALEADSPGRRARSFRVAVGSDVFAVEVRHLPELTPYAGSLPEEARQPSDTEVLAICAGLFLEGVKGGAA